MTGFKDQKVLVFGLGLNDGGVGSAKFFAKNGARVKVTDLKNEKDLKPSLDKLKDFPDIEYSLGEHKYEDIDWADLIIKNPSVKPKNPYIEYALKNGKKVDTDMGIFLQSVNPSQIVGITGTKGKSTTSSLIYEVLKRHFSSVQKDNKVVFGGNIGKSVLDAAEQVDKNTLVVLELSSFQLEAFDQHKISPKWAVVTNIYPDHLNYYSSMKKYTKAKKVIGKYQTPQDFLFINKDDPTLKSAEFLEGLKGKIIFYSYLDLPENFISNLAGEHNKSNMAAVLSLGKQFEIDEKIILETLKDFKGVPFRMELIKIWNGVKIINDTTATGPDAGIQALKTFPNSILICGGMNKNMPYDEYSKAVRKYAKKVFFLEGNSTEEIKKQLSVLNSSPREAGQFSIGKTYDNIETLLQDIKSIAESGDIILFSPAATSFNLFQNEFDRGRKFNEIVEKIFS